MSLSVRARANRRLSSAAVSSSSGSIVSSSTRNNWCAPLVVNLVFTVVGRCDVANSRASMRSPAVATRRSISAPASSAPMTPTRIARAPNAATLWATLAAPPKLARAAVTRSTGIGASGEIRLTSPDTYRSSITSPRTSTVRPTKSGMRPAIVPSAFSPPRKAPAACSIIDTGRPLAPTGLDRNAR